MNIQIKAPTYENKKITTESSEISELARCLNLDKHPNGGYFKETDRPKDIQIINGLKRNSSSLIHFLMTCESPIGKFHTNLTSRTIHILQRGSGIYVLIHPNNEVEIFKVGFNVENGEKTQWVVEPNTYKGCYLINDQNEESNNDCLWVSEVVVPGFDFEDMKFLNKDDLTSKLGTEQAEKFEFLI
jgi:predicted cupin superfamily sugar epimerase